MLHSPAEIISYYLIRKEFSRPIPTTLSWGTYIDVVPDKKLIGGTINVVSILNQTGKQSGRRMDGTVNRHPGVQFIIRSRLHSTSYNKMEELIPLITENMVRKLITVEEIQYRFESLTLTSEPIRLDPPEGLDFRGWSLNATCTITQLT